MHWITGCAISGLLVWPALLLLSPIPLLDALFLIAPMVIVPLGLGLTGEVFENSPARSIHRAACLIQPLAAGMVVVAFLIPQGTTSAWFTAGWALLTLLCGLIGAIHLANSGFRNLVPLCIAAAYLYLPVGGLWLIFSRLGASLLEFQQPIVLLTATHFHYTGFTTLILIYQSRFFAEPQRGDGFFRMAAIAAIVGTPLLAVGFIISPWIKLFAVVLLTVGMLSLSALVFTSKRQTSNAIAQSFIRFSCICVSATILLALIYAVGEITGHIWITIAQMVILHGIANAFGFATAGMIGWTLARIKA